MFISRLFNRRSRRRAPTEPPAEQDQRSDLRPVRSDAATVQAHRTLAQILSRPRPLQESDDRVGAAVRLVDALRRLENHRFEHGPPSTLFVALALRELDILVDSMSYDELWDAFGGEFTTTLFVSGAAAVTPPLTPRLPLLWLLGAGQCGITGMRDEDIKTLATREISKEEAHMLDGACSVCLEGFSPGEGVR